MDELVEPLRRAGVRWSFVQFSALDAYFGEPPLNYRWVQVDAELQNLARWYDELLFPGAMVADAMVQKGEQVLFFRCGTSLLQGLPAYRILTLSYQPEQDVFYDPEARYWSIRSLRTPHLEKVPWWDTLDSRSSYERAAFEGAILLARYTEPALLVSPAEIHDEILRIVAETILDLSNHENLPIRLQQLLLYYVLSSKNTALALRLLKEIGFIHAYWPELDALETIDHAKEYHPEGNGWEHTLETFRHRKKSDFVLSLALLLHDIGKPLADVSGSHRFDRHAELGAQVASRFLERLEFPPSLIEKVHFLVRHHMMPAALPKLPYNRVKDALANPLFPLLLELYRCDEASSFKGLDGYYASAALYQNYLRNRRNPYRREDGQIERPLF